MPLRIIFWAAAFAALGTVPACGAPTAYYNPATGHLRISNDFPFAPTHFFVQSLSGHGLTIDAAAFAVIPGAHLETGDLPLVFS